ncbi:MAG: SDR family oxidoreductase [Deltaproteobacteria bacterium]|nr:SDR family oxidoreductase [Deltaproteobacteria bacterium]
MRTLSGQVSIVTGASRGIGRAIALVLGESGSRVVLASRSEPELTTVREEIRKKGGDALVMVSDLTREDDLRKLVNGTLQEWGRIDYLINNAGWGKHAPVAKARLEDWDRTFQTNLRAPMILSQLVLPILIEQKAGAIVNISSISGKTGQAESSAYSASKFGLIGFSQSLFEEVREYGIKVATILPGYVDTPMIPPVRRLDRSKMIRPEDIAHTVLFILTSPASCCPVEITVRPQQTPYK